MTNALIVDDEPNARERIRALLSPHKDIHILAECGDGVSAIEAISRLRPDLLFLDIQMPELNGFETLARIEPELMPTTIFVTAYDEHALKAFDVGAVDYVLKPIVPERFERAVVRARGRSWLEHVVVERRGRMTVIGLDAVSVLEAEGNYVRLHTADDKFLMRGTLQSLERRLDPSSFVRVHRSFVLNVRQVVTVAPGQHGDAFAVTTSGARVPVSRTRAPLLKQQLRP